MRYFWRELPQVFAVLDADETVRAVIVRGEGKHFSYGLDLPAMMGSGELSLSGENLAAERTKLFDGILRMQDAVSSVATCRKPVIAAIAGWCIGGGLDALERDGTQLAAGVGTAGSFEPPRRRRAVSSRPRAGT